MAVDWRIIDYVNYISKAPDIGVDEPLFGKAVGEYLGASEMFFRRCDIFVLANHQTIQVLLNPINVESILSSSLTDLILEVDTNTFVGKVADPTRRVRIQRFNTQDVWVVDEGNVMGIL